MRVKDQISDKYLEAVNLLIGNHPDSDRTASLRHGELNEIWEEIHNDLDLEETWIRISSDLDILIPPKYRNRIIFKGCAAILLLLFGLIPIKKVMPDEDFTKPKVSTGINLDEDLNGLAKIDKVADPGVETDLHLNLLPKSLDKQHDIVPAAIVIPAEKNEIDADILIACYKGTKDVIGISVAPATEGTPLAASPEETPGKRPDSSPVLVSSSPEEPEVAFIPDTDYLKPARGLERAGSLRQSVNTSRFTGGILTSFKNTWLLNQETFDGLKSESLGTTEIVVFPDAGLTVGYSLTGKWLLQADAFLFSNTGQEYFDYIYGHYSRKRIVLKYSTVALSVKYKTGSKGNHADRSSINFFSGCYLSFLHSADKKINSETEKVRSDYTNLDFGIRLGGEFELHLGDYLSIAPGLALTLGITNIYKGDGEIPAHLRTHNGSAEFQLSFYYHFD